jgi:hypothetical protein
VANLAVARAEDEVAYKKLSSYAKFGWADANRITVETEKKAALEDTQKITETLAKALSDGAITDIGYGYEVLNAEKLAKYGLEEEDLAKYYEQVGGATEDLRDFGNALLETDRQAEAAFGALAASAYSLADTLGMTDEEKEQASNIVDDATV